MNEMKKSDLAIIRRGITHLHELLNVVINKPMKDRSHRKCNEWLSSNNHTFTSGGRMRHLTLADIAKWVLFTWNERVRS